MYHYIKAGTSDLNIEIDCNKDHLISIVKAALHLEKLINVHPLKVVYVSKPNPVLRKPIATDKDKLALNVPVCFRQFKFTSRPEPSETRDSFMNSYLRRILCLQYALCCVPLSFPGSKDLPVDRLRLHQAQYHQLQR